MNELEREVLEKKLDQRTRERDALRVLYRQQNVAMGVLFERLREAGVDCSDLISYKDVLERYGKWLLY